ncbi:MAG: hypothetical protein IKK63_08020 [Clostridia bacterium]|nr:hypothetical protein [Clostridia bacterium]MBR3818836.1 hypothetical protein [Clostridia bacterium]
MSNTNISFKDMLVKGALIFNPVLIQLVGLCPVVAASTTLAGSVALSVALFVELTATCVIASALFKKVPRWVRVPLYLIIGLALICPILWYIETKTLINISLGMKIYIPLIAINSVTAVHCEQFAVKNSVRHAFYDAAAVSIGASAVMLIVGATREIFGSGSLAGVKLELPVIFKGMAMPFGCLILLGFMAAGLKAFLNYRYLGEDEAEPDDIQEAEKILDSGVEEVEIFDEFWSEQTEEEQPEPEEKAQPETKEEIRDSANEDIEDFFRSIGIDYYEKGDEQ